jgi:hypothetical protein
LEGDEDEESDELDELDESEPELPLLLLPPSEDDADAAASLFFDPLP